MQPASGSVASHKAPKDASHGTAAAHAHELRARPTIALPCRCEVGYTTNPVSLAKRCIWHAVQLLGNIGWTPSAIICSHLRHFEGHHSDARKRQVYLDLKVQWYLRAAAWLAFKHVLMQTPPSRSKGKKSCSWQRCAVITIQVQLQYADIRVRATQLGTMPAGSPGAPRCRARL